MFTKVWLENYGIDFIVALVFAVDRRNSQHLPAPHMVEPRTHPDHALMHVRRNRLLEDSLAEMARQSRRDLLKPLRVNFIGENGIDAGVRAPWHC